MAPHCGDDQETRAWRRKAELLNRSADAVKRLGQKCIQQSLKRSSVAVEESHYEHNLAIQLIAIVNTVSVLAKEILPSITAGTEAASNVQALSESQYKQSRTNQVIVNQNGLIEKLKKELALFRQENGKLQIENQNLKMKLLEGNDANWELEQLRLQNGKYKKEMEALERAVKKFEETCRQIQPTEEDCAERQKTAGDLETRLAAAAQAFFRYKNRLSRLLEEIQRQKEELALLERQVQNDDSATRQVYYEEKRIQAVIAEQNDTIKKQAYESSMLKEKLHSAEVQLKKFKDHTVFAEWEERFRRYKNQHEKDVQEKRQLETTCRNYKQLVETQQNQICDLQQSILAEKPFEVDRHVMNNPCVEGQQQIFLSADEEQGHLTVWHDARQTLSEEPNQHYQTSQNQKTTNQIHHNEQVHQPSNGSLERRLNSSTGTISRHQNQNRSGRKEESLLQANQALNDRILELQKMQKNKDGIILTQQETIKNLLGDREKLRIQNKHLHAENEKRKQRSSDLDTLLNSATDTIFRHQTEISQLEQENVEQKRQLALLQSQLEATLDAEEQNSAVQEAKINDLLVELARLRNANDALENNLQQNSQLCYQKAEERLTYYVNQHNKDAQEKFKLNELCNDSQRLIKIQNEQISRYQQQLSAREGELLQLRVKETRPQHCQTDPHADFGLNLPLYLDEKISEHRNRIAELERKLAQQTHSCEEHRARAEQLENALSECQKQKEKLSSMLRSKKGQQSQPETLNCNVQVSEHQMPKINLEEFQDANMQKALETIAEICRNTQEIKAEVDEFSGTKQDKTYLHLKEVLLRNIIKLDNVETEGYFAIRKMRKEAIQYVQGVMEALERNVQ